MYSIVIDQEKPDLLGQLSKYKEGLIAVAPNNNSYGLVDAITKMEDQNERTFLPT